MRTPKLVAVSLLQAPDNVSTVYPARKGRDELAPVGAVVEIEWDNGARTLHPVKPQTTWKLNQWLALHPGAGPYVGAMPTFAAFHESLKETHLFCLRLDYQSLFKGKTERPVITDVP